MRRIKFSIRQLLALMFFVALGLVAWRTWQDVRDSQTRGRQLRSQIEALEAEVRLEQPALHQAMLNARDEHDALRQMRERAVGQFEVLREKYSTMEARGAGILSVREIPSLHLNGEPSSSIYRMLIPDERPVWLKFGVHGGESPQNTSEALDSTTDFATTSPFSRSGPYEIRLPPGNHTLKIVIGTGESDTVSLVAMLDDKQFFRAAVISQGTRPGSSSRISAPRQLDFEQQQELPWLMTMELEQRNAAQPPVMLNEFSFWLSDRASGFEEFPAE